MNLKYTPKKAKNIPQKEQKSIRANLPIIAETTLVKLKNAKG
jgi:hypothetical protein